MPTTLLNPGCGPCNECECKCQLVVALFEPEEFDCRLVATVSLVYVCDGVTYELDLDEYGVTGRMTGDFGVIWEGPVSELPDYFSAEISDSFELEVWVTTYPGVYYGENCDDISPVTDSYLFDPSCKVCEEQEPCTCFDGEFVAVTDATITISGSVSTVVALPGHGCVGHVGDCPDINGTYVVPCSDDVQWFVIYEYFCTFSGTDIYSGVLLVVDHTTTSIDVQLYSGTNSTHLGGPITPGVVISGTGTLPSGFASIGPRTVWHAESFHCDADIDGVLFYRCSRTLFFETDGSAPNNGHCDLRDLDISKA